MKTTIRLKEFTDLSRLVVQVPHATALASPESSPQPKPEGIQGFHVPLDGSGESFRELMHQRYTAPFPCESPYQRGGINE